MRAFIIASIMLSGCAANMAWHHSSKSQQEFYRDNSQCLAMMGSTLPFPTAQPAPAFGNSGGMAAAFSNGMAQGQAIGAAYRQNTIYEQCMLGLGWSLGPVGNSDANFRGNDSGSSTRKMPVPFREGCTQAVSLLKQCAD